MIKNKIQPLIVSFVLNPCLCLSLILAPAASYANNEPAVQESAPEETQETEVTTQEQIAQLRAEILGLRGTDPSSLDPFMMVRQQVVDDRSDNVTALIDAEAIENFESRKAYYEEQVSSLTELLEQAKAKVNRARSLVRSAENSNGSLNEQVQKRQDQLAETIFIRDDINSRLAIATLHLDDAIKSDPSVSEQQLQSFIDNTLATRHHFRRNLLVNMFVKDNEGVVAELRQSDFSESLSPRFSSGELAAIKADSFQLAKPNGEVLHNFDVPVSAIGFFGRFLVFYETDSVFNTDYTTLKFIDLNYAATNIGNAPLPVFSLPLKSSNSPRSIQIVDGKLNIDDVTISHESLVFLSQNQQILFNVSVALVDPTAREKGTDLIEQVHEFYQKAMEAQSNLVQAQVDQSIRIEELIAVEEANAATLGEISTKEEELTALLQEALKDKKITDEEFAELSLNMEVKTVLPQTNNALFNARRLSTRMKMLWAYLKQPRPEGAPALQNTLLALATSKTKEDRGRTWTLMKESLAGKITKFGITAAAVTAAIAVLPESYKDYLFQSTDLISATYAHFMGYLSHIDYGRNYGIMSKDAFITSTTGFTYFYSSYLADGNWTKFLWGLGSILMVPVKIFASFHFIVNGFNMFSQTVRQSQLQRGQTSWLTSLGLAAVKNEERFIQGRADAEKKISGSDLSQITQADVTLLEQEIARLDRGGEQISSEKLHIKTSKKERRKARMSRAYSATIGLFQRKKTHAIAVNQQASKPMYNGNYFKGLRSWFTKEGSQQVRDLGGAEGLSTMVPQDTKGLGASLKQFLLSGASVRQTFKFSALFWNFFFVPRTFAFSPKMWMMFFVYPNFFKETTKDLTSQRFPSEFNPGLYGWLKKAQLSSSRLAPRRLTKSNGLISKVLFSKIGLYQLKKFEATTKNVEPEIIKYALRKAQIALIERVQDPERIISILDSASIEGRTSTGISSLYDPKLKSLTSEERSFFRLYFTRTYDSVMKNFWSLILATQNEQDYKSIEGYVNMGPRELGRSMQRDIQRGDLTFSSISKDDAKVYTKNAIDMTDLETIRSWAERVTTSFSGTATRVRNNFRHDLLRKLNPTNTSLARYMTVKNKVSDPNAIERATRAELTGLKVSLPLGMITALGIYAGVDTGVLQVFDPNGLDTDTHKNYFSRQLFYAGFIPGIFIGLMGGTWMKIQEDSRMDDLKGFDSAVLFEDQRKGFWRFMFKNFSKHPQNKWMQNQLFYMKIIIANLSAAATTIIASQLLGLGRIDVGMFLAGYLVMFITPLMGFGLKMEQSFELTKSWVSSKIPIKLRAHPKAQDFISKKLQQKRYGFTFFNQIFNVVAIENLFGDMVVLKDNVIVGTRGTLRLIFGGDTPTVLIDKGLESIGNAAQNIPGVTGLTDGLQHLFTNNYEAFERFPERLTSLGSDTVQRVIEDPTLPVSAVGEFLGKISAAALTLGGFAMVPYAGAIKYQAFKERWLQRQGLELRQSQAAANAMTIEGEAVEVEPSNTATQVLSCRGILRAN